MNPEYLPNKKLIGSLQNQLVRKPSTLPHSSNGYLSGYGPNGQCLSEMERYSDYSQRTNRSSYKSSTVNGNSSSSNNTNNNLINTNHNHHHHNHTHGHHHHSHHSHQPLSANTSSNSTTNINSSPNSNHRSSVLNPYNNF